MQLNWLTLYRCRAEARRWPRVVGKIVSSDVTGVKARVYGVGLNSFWRTFFRSRKTSPCSVRSIAYQSDGISFGAQADASFRRLARPRARRHVAGQAVEVWHDLASALDPEVPGIFLIPLIATSLFATDALPGHGRD